MGRTSAGIGGYAITQAQHQKDFPDRTKGDAVLAATVIGASGIETGQVGFTFSTKNPSVVPIVPTPGQKSKWKAQLKVLNQEGK
jgi:hypothetical protein